MYKKKLPNKLKKKVFPPVIQDPIISFLMQLRPRGITYKVIVSKFQRKGERKKI